MRSTRNSYLIAGVVLLCLLAPSPAPAPYTPSTTYADLDSMAGIPVGSYDVRGGWASLISVVNDRDSDRNIRVNIFEGRRQVLVFGFEVCLPVVDQWQAVIIEDAGVATIYSLDVDTPTFPAFPAAGVQFRWGSFNPVSGVTEADTLAGTVEIIELNECVTSTSDIVTFPYPSDPPFVEIALTPPDPLNLDDDGDGYTVEEGDCDDTSVTVYPDAPEVCGDGIDQDCDGSDPECEPGPTPDGPSRPQLLSPLDAASIGIQDVQLEVSRFFHEDPGREHFKTEWQVSRDPSFSGKILHSVSETLLTRLGVPELTLNAGTTYFWRVRFIDNQSGISEWSETFSFSIEASTTDLNGNGIPDALEVDETVDLDRDGTADRDQADIKSLNTVTGSGQMGMRIKAATPFPFPLPFPIPAEGATIEAVASLDPAAISSLARPAHMPLGLFAARIAVPEKGDTARATIYFSEAAPDDASWYIHDPIGGWADYSAHATFSRDRLSVELEFQDGGFGDADGAANGIVVDPGGFGIASWAMGEVLDFSSDTPVRKASVMIGDLEISTGNDGKYLSVILPGTYDIAVSAKGFEPAAASGQKVQEAGVLTVDFALDPAPDPTVRFEESTGSVLISLDPRDELGKDADWWLVAVTGGGPYYLNLSPFRWEPWPQDLPPTYQGPLFDLPPFEVGNVPGLPGMDSVSGIYFGVDLTRDGAVSAPLWYHGVEMNGEED